MFKPVWVCADGRLFVINRFMDTRSLEGRKIECYDPDSNSWNGTTQISLDHEMLSGGMPASENYMVSSCCSMSRLFLKTQECLEQASSCEESLSEECLSEGYLWEECSTRSHKRLLDVSKRKCTVT